jgi:threonine dehydratase
MLLESIPQPCDIYEARQRITPYIHRTPLLTCQTLDESAGCKLFFKCENFQKAGAFKSRGACNAVFSLESEEASKGVATHSSGNHAQALARAASLRGIKSYIVMPRTAPEVKILAVKHYKGEITFCEPTLTAREETLKNVIQQTGAIEIHPYNNYSIIAGQSTAAMEIFEEIGWPDFLITPVGGGGLLSGSSLAALYFSNHTKVLGAEPEGADDAYHSFHTGKIVPSLHPVTIADGLLTSLGSKTFPIIKKNVFEILRVSEQNIVKAMQMIWERMKIIVEPSAAVPLGAILQYPEIFLHSKTAIILSGGNVDLNKLPFTSH